MNKALVKYQIKEWIGLFAIITAIFAIVSITIAFNYDFSHYHIYNYSTNGEIEGYLYTKVYAFPPLGFINTPFLIATSVVPLYALSYRFKKNKADAYYQLPLKENELKNTRLLLGLIGILIIFTVVYWLSFLVLGIRYNIYLDNNPTLTTSDINLIGPKFIYTIPLYFVLLFAGSANYFTSALFISQGNNILDSILHYVFGEIFLLLAIYVLVNPIDIIFFKGFLFDNDTYFSSSIILQTDLSVVGLGDSTHYIFYPLLSGDTFESNKNMIRSIIVLSIGVGIGIGSCVYMLNSKDPSGEYAGSIGPRNLVIEIFPHISMLFLTFMTGYRSSFSGLHDIIFFLIYYSAYYIIIAVLRRNIKIKLKDVIWIGVNFVVLLVLMFITIA